MSHWVQHKVCWFPGRMKVCGLWLKPLSLGHLRLLEIIESPFLTGGTIGIEDLFVAIAILRFPLGYARWMVGKRWLLRLEAIRILKRKMDWKKEAEVLSQYLSDNQWMPERYDSQNEPSCNVFDYASSFSMRVAWHLSAKLGQGVPDINHPVWKLTVIECLAWRLTEMELSGREYVTRDEAELTNQAVAAQVALEAEQFKQQEAYQEAQQGTNHVG